MPHLVPAVWVGTPFQEERAHLFVVGGGLAGVQEDGHALIVDVVDARSVRQHDVEARLVTLRRRQAVEDHPCERTTHTGKRAPNLTEFNRIATPCPDYVGNPGWHRTRKPMAYRVSCCTHNPRLNIPRSFKIVIYLILEHIYTVSSINTFPWRSIPFIYRSLRKCILSYVYFL